MITLERGSLTATWHPEAGMVCSSLQVDGAELLGQRAGLEAYAREGKTFGIPLLHPWANRLGADRFEVAGKELDLSAARHDEHGLPIHGLMPGTAWRVVEQGRHLVIADLDFAERPEFPFAHVIRVEAWLTDDALVVRTRVAPTTEDPVPIAFGWHPYLQVGAQTLTVDADRQLLLDERGLPTGQTASPPAPGPLGVHDDLFAGVRALSVSGDRTVTVAFLEGYSFGQVFAPEGKPFVALEPMTAATDALRTGDVVLADEPYDATFAIQIS